MEKFKPLFIILFLTCFFFYGCKKKEENPSPHTYRIKENNGGVFTYNSDGKLSEYYDGNAIWLTYSYDEMKRLINSTLIVNGQLYLTQYEYDNIGRILSVTEFLDRNQTRLNRAITYYYNQENNIDYSLGKFPNGSDSIHYSGYINHKPTIIEYFGPENFKISTDRYTYDNRMNCIKRELKKNTDSDFHTIEESLYENVINYPNWTAVLCPNEIPLFASPYSPDLTGFTTNQDFLVSNQQFELCGGTNVLKNDFKVKITKTNSIGLPLKMKTTYSEYACGVLSQTSIDSTSFIYE